MRIEFTSHADQKIEILGRHGVKVTRSLVEETLLDPGKDRVRPRREAKSPSEVSMTNTF